jgi:hypothetical protein
MTALHNIDPIAAALVLVIVVCLVILVRRNRL